MDRKLPSIGERIRLLSLDYNVLDTDSTNHAMFTGIEGTITDIIHIENMTNNGDGFHKLFVDWDNTTANIVIVHENDMYEVIPKEGHQYHPLIHDSEVIGYECREDFYKYKKSKCTAIIKNLRVNHLVKRHGYKKSSLPKESNFNDLNERHFTLKLQCSVVCSHCDNIMNKYASDKTEFVYYVCLNDDCSYKKQHNHWNYIHEFIGRKAKFFCLRHNHNSHTKKCNSCEFSKNFNMKIAPKINSFLSKKMR